MSSTTKKAPLTEFEAGIIWNIRNKGWPRNGCYNLAVEEIARLLGSEPGRVTNSLRKLDGSFLAIWPQGELAVLSLDEYGKRLYQTAVEVLTAPSPKTTELHPIDVQTIRKLYWIKRVRLPRIAKFFGISEGHVLRIAKGELFPDEPMPPEAEGKERREPLRRAPLGPGQVKVPDRVVVEMRERFHDAVERDEWHGLMSEMATEYGISAVHAYFIVAGDQRVNSGGPLPGRDYDFTFPNRKKPLRFGNGSGG